MKTCSLCFSLSLAFACLGCLASETTEYKITMNEDGKSGTMISIMRNVQSDESDEAEQTKDFEEAIRAWKGTTTFSSVFTTAFMSKTELLPSKIAFLSGKKRQFFPTWQMSSNTEFNNDTLKFVIKGDQSIVATNGVIVPAKDSTVVYWRVSALKEIIFETKENNFTPKSDFAAKFKAYMNEQK